MHYDSWFVKFRWRNAFHFTWPQNDEFCLFVPYHGQTEECELSASVNFEEKKGKKSNTNHRGITSIEEK